MRAARTSGLLTLAALALAACGGDGADTEAGAAGDTMGGAMAADTGVITVADIGLQTPESILHDTEADVYLVSNINGAPLEKDDNGYISRIRPDGSVESLRGWIDGADEDVTLHAPKGLALKGDTLFVADIDSVRAFHRTTGEPLGARGVPDADFLNDLAVVDGTLYVSDTGMDAQFQPTGNGAIYRMTGTGAERIADGQGLGTPNGISSSRGGLLVAPFGSAEVRLVQTNATGGAGEAVVTMPGGQLDGIIGLETGEFFASSWETQAVYHVTPGNEVHEIITGVESPADIGHDAQRNRILIPLFMGNELQFHPLPY